MNLTTQYMGLSLPNPLIASSSSLSADLSGVKKLADAGAGAIVLKSLFEEDIVALESENRNDDNAYVHPEAAAYISNMSMLVEPNSYLALVEESVKSVHVPIIASLNCYSSHWWVDYAERIANVGAHAIELNISPMTSDPKINSARIEDQVVNMVSMARKAVDIPLAVKIGPGFASLPHLIKRIESAGANALTIFNRFYKVDIDIENISFQSGNSLSRPEEFGTVLRWIGILSDITNMDISASTGIYDAKSVIKAILAGGQATQLCSVLYKQGLTAIKTILDELKEWMNVHEFQSPDDFRGFLSLKNDQRNDFYERLQYVKILKGY